MNKLIIILSILSFLTLFSCTKKEEVQTQPVVTDAEVEQPTAAEEATPENHEESTHPELVHPDDQEETDSADY